MAGPVAPPVAPTRRYRTPTVIQMEAVECGAASLAMILGYYGRFVPLEILRTECDVSRDGSNALNILKVARKYGLEAEGHKAQPTELPKLGLPMIVFWNLNHFVVVEGVHKRGVYLNDPGSGPHSVTFEEFDQSFTGIALTFKLTPDFKKGGVRKTFWSSLGKRIKGSEVALMFVFLVSFLLTIPGLIQPCFQKVYVDEILGKGLHDWILGLLAFMLGIAVVQSALGWMQSYYLLRFSTRLALSSSADFMWHVLRLPPEFFAQRFAGEISTRVALNDNVANIISGKLAKAALNTLMICFYAAIMLCYNRELTLLVIVLAVINFLVLTLVGRLRTDLNKRLLQDSGKLMGTTISGLQTIETIKATGRENDFFSRWAGYQAKVMNSSQTLGITSQLVGTVPGLLSAVGNVLVLCLGGLSVMEGTLTIGMLVAFQALMGNFMSPINQLVELGSNLQEAEGDMNRLDDVFHNQIMPLGPPLSPDAPRPIKLSGRLELKDVCFGYGRLAPPLIKDFNLVIEPGQRVAVVGATGSGKSTIARIVTGLFQPWSGDVLLDGKRRNEIPQSVITSSMAHVDQEIMLFGGTLRENLTLWDMGIADEQILRACHDAYILDSVTSRPAGLDSPVEEGGSNFSGGERQRLEIARALVGNPALLVLDEATSALDPLVEKSIDERIRARGCSCLIIAHRLSTIRDADQIIVLHRGVVAQRGTHEELVAVPGPYRDLIQSEPGA